MLLYLLGSVAGIGLLVALNLALFGRARPDVGDSAEIGARLAQEVPGFRAGNFALASDRRAALMENASDRAIFLIEALGDEVVTRRLSRGLVTRIAREQARLSLELADFTMPRAIISLETDALAKEWQAKLTV